MIYFSNLFTDNQQVFTMVMTPSSWACPPAHTALFRVTPIMCAVKCQRQETCLMFATDQGICVTTNFSGKPDVGAFDTYNEWYRRELA